MDRKKCKCGAWATKKSNHEYCFWCDPNTSPEKKKAARLKAGAKTKIPVDVRTLSPLLPIEDEEGMSKFINELLRQNLKNYADDYDRYLTQTLRVLPRLNDLMVYRVLSEQRQLLEAIKLIKENDYFLTERDYVESFDKTVTNGNSEIISGDPSEARGSH